MAKVSKNDAFKKLSNEIAKFRWDDLVESHNELFPFEPVSVDEGPIDAESVKSKVLNRISDGLEAEEVIDLWNVVFPLDRNVWYDEENHCVQFNGEPQHVETSD